MATSISLRLPENLAEKLEGIAKTTERSRSYLIRKAVEEYIEEFEDAQIALQRLHDDDDKVISGKELRKRLGISG